MFLWALSFLAFGFGAERAFRGVDVTEGITRLGRERRALARVGALLLELEETLAAGLLPAPERWAVLRALPEPWGELSHESLQELRSAGGAVLPTLRRLRGLAAEQDAALGEARARSSQALAQAAACGVLVPLFGATLKMLMPALDAAAFRWALACALALGWAGVGAFWMLSLAESARWGGLPSSKRHWALYAACAGERFLAVVRAGTPADLAWARACALLGEQAPGLAMSWGASVWSQSAEGIARAATLEHFLEDAGEGLKRAVQVSLMEGRPCTDRIEAGLSALRQETRARVDRELALLPARTLKPLFACVAPSMLGLLAYALWLGGASALGGAGLGL